MFNKILNYGIRIIIIVFGILIFFDYFNLSRGDNTMVRAFGAIMVLFGVYRIFSYRSASQRYQNLKEKNDED
ncbi:MAG: hypothetical protein A2X64_02520 [Ignavibacteria bacterium GWF2_33_9]|nr:MAG: hypothetical protein A2X64_02520 [Ignavibacteria bacterium GWF2_33_9]